MTTGTIKTQGTELFFVHTLQSDPTLVKLLCPTGLTGLGSGTPDQIESTCLSTVGDKEFVSGLRGPSPVSVPFNFIPTAISHQDLLDLKAAGTVIPWLAAMSDGTAAPTVDTDGALVPPAGSLRTSCLFNGYVAECSFDVANNEIVRGTLSIQRSGTETWTFPTATQ